MTWKIEGIEAVAICDVCGKEGRFEDRKAEDWSFMMMGSMRDTKTFSELHFCCAEHHVEHMRIHAVSFTAQLLSKVIGV